MASVTLDVKGLKAIYGTSGILGRLNKFGRIEIDKLTREQAEEAATFARNIAPVRTGALIQGIKTSGRGKNTYAVISKMPEGQNRRDGKPRPYHMFMHGLMVPNTSHKKFSGDNRYMFTTLKSLKEGYPRKVRSRLRKTISGKELFT